MSEIASRAHRGLLGVCDFVCYLVLAAMAIIITSEVASRYLLGSSLQIAEEAASLGLVAFIFLSLPGTFSEDGFLRIDALYDVLCGRLRVLLSILFSICALAVTSVYVWQLTSLTIDSFQRGNRSDMALGTPNFVPQAFMVAGIAILFLAVLAGLISTASKFLKRQTDA